MYTLTNAVEMNKKHPTTFEVPSEQDIKDLTIGTHVKLIFVNAEGKGERMWVQISEINGNNFVGILDNDPIFIELTAGARVEFNNEHIAGIF